MKITSQIVAACTRAAEQIDLDTECVHVHRDGSVSSGTDGRSTTPRDWRDVAYTYHPARAHDSWDCFERVYSQPCGVCESVESRIDDLAATGEVAELEQFGTRLQAAALSIRAGVLALDDSEAMHTVMPLVSLLGSGSLVREHLCHMVLCLADAALSRSSAVVWRLQGQPSLALSREADSERALRKAQVAYYEAQAWHDEVVERDSA